MLGFLNGHTEVDVGRGDRGDRPSPTSAGPSIGRIDSCISTDRAWRELRTLPGLDQVLTAGSARGVAEGLDDLVARARADARARRLIMAGGGLQAEHVPWLARAGVRAFHIGTAARPARLDKAYVDADLVGPGGP